MEAKNSGRLFYDSSNSDGCQEFSHQFKQKLGKAPVILTKRGNCTYADKAHNIEKAGGAVAVFINDQPKDVSRTVVSFSGSTFVGIPSILISSTDGDKLVNFLQGSDLKLTSKAYVTVDFSLQTIARRAEYEFWYSSGDYDSWDLLGRFGAYQKQLKKRASFSPHIFTWSCPMCDQDFKSHNCISDGEYCETAAGLEDARELLFEDLRHMCLFELYGNKRKDYFWLYVETATELCKYPTESCSRLVHKELTLPWKKT